MTTFIALYRAPVSVLDDWMKTPEETRKAEEEKMQAKWNEWMAANGAHIKSTASAGKTKRVSLSGVEDTRNDIMMYTLVEAESPEAAAEMFKNHPHLDIPQSTIDIMAASPLPDMGA